MEEKEVKQLVEELKKYQSLAKDVAANKTDKKVMKAFRTYYEKVFKDLVVYIQYSKDKHLSDTAKQLPVLKDVFKNFNILIVVIVVMMITPLALIVYLYTLSVKTWIYAIIGVDVVALFFIVKLIQNESKKVINIIVKGTPVIQKVIRIIEKNSK
jgi:hypothetical protein